MGSCVQNSPGVISMTMQKLFWKTPHDWGHMNSDFVWSSLLGRELLPPSKVWPGVIRAQDVKRGPVEGAAAAAHLLCVSAAPDRLLQWARQRCCPDAVYRVCLEYLVFVYGNTVCCTHGWWLLHEPLTFRCWLNKKGIQLVSICKFISTAKRCS